MTYFYLLYSPLKSSTQTQHSELHTHTIKKITIDTFKSSVLPVEHNTVITSLNFLILPLPIQIIPPCYTTNRLACLESAFVAVSQLKDLPITQW